MLTKRIIPCLDIIKGRVVKGTNFEKLKDAGDPVQLASKYYKSGADELIFLDITASNENRKTLIDLVRKVARELFIPFTVGGGVSSVEDIKALLFAGADKVAINTAAIKNPDLISQASKKFGSQCVVVAVDVKRKKRGWEVYSNGGKVPTGKDAIAWLYEAQKLGAGEILLTSMDADGTRNGYDLELLTQASKLKISVIASGGAGCVNDFANAFFAGADAVLAASLFHYNLLGVQQLKEQLAKKGIRVRIC